MKLRFLLIYILVQTVSIIPLSAGRIIVDARLDSATMLMGTVNTLYLEVTQDKNVRGDFPILQRIGENGFTTLLNDTVEVRKPLKIDTADVGSGRIRINYQIPLQVFDSGTYRLPGFVYLSDRDTSSSKPLMLSVVPVNVKADDKISPLTDVSEPEDSSIFDSLPDWLYYWWWLILIAIVIITGGLWAWHRYRKVGSILSPKPETPPHILALERLKRLKSRNLWQTGQEKEFYTILTDILRSYLDSRFNIKAMEMTSRQIMTKLSEDPSLRDNRSRMRQILDMADFVKFAMVRPLPDDNIKAYDNAVAFVESTSPVSDIVETDDQTPFDQSPDRNASGVISGKHHLKVVTKHKKKRKGGES